MEPTALSWMSLRRPSPFAVVLALVGDGRSHSGGIDRAGSVVGPWTPYENGEPGATMTAQVHEQLIFEGERTVVQVIEVK